MSDHVPHTTCNETQFVIFLGGDDAHVRVTDPRVLQLARAIYRRHSPYDPLTTYQHTMNRDASIPHPTFDGNAPGQEPLNSLELLRFRDACLHHFPADLVAAFSEDLEKQCTTDMVVGDRRRAFAFTQESDAKFAITHDAAYRKVTGSGVVAFLVRCLSHPLKRLGMQGDALPCMEPTPVETLASIMEGKDDGFVSGFGHWMQLTENINAGSLKPPTRTTVIHGDAAVVLTIVHHHWQVIEPTVLSHRLIVNCTLYVMPNALYGGHIFWEYTRSNHDQWPWWASTVTMQIDRTLLTIVTRKELIRRIRQRPSLDMVVLPDLHLPDNKRLRTVIDKWTKSAHSMGTSTPYLCRLLSLPESFSYGNFSARRLANKEDCVTSGLFTIFKDEFGAEYTNGVLERTLADDMAAVYIVERDVADGDGGQPVAAFVLLLYEAVFYDGGVGTACMIDSFAVKHTVQGQGIGGQVFHKLCRGIAKYQSRTDLYTRHVMFAQCLTTKRPRDFWVDKLDDSGMARALLLQASIMSPERIPIHANCCARGRIYYEAKE